MHAVVFVDALVKGCCRSFSKKLVHALVAFLFAGWSPVLLSLLLFVVGGGGSVLVGVVDVAVAVPFVVCSLLLTA